MKKVYSDEEMEMYSQNPKVLYICRNRMTLTMEFKRELYAAWSENPKPLTIKKVLIENGFDIRSIGHDFYKNIALAFSRSGEPKFSKSPAYNAGKTMYGAGAISDTGFQPSKTDDAPIVQQRKASLIETGKFIQSGRGIWFSPEFEKELLDGYPETSIRQGILNAGVSLREIGYYQVRKLEKKARKGADRSIGLSEKAESWKEPLRAPEQNTALCSNPYVEYADEHTIRFSDKFYGGASILSELSVEEILDVFLIDHSLLYEKEKSAISSRIRESAPLSAQDVFIEGTVRELVVLRRREMALERLAEDGFSRMTEVYPSLDGLQKKRLCLWINSLPKDPGHKCSKTSIIKRLGITRSVYYLYVKDKDFGLGGERKKEADRRDAEIVRMAFDYKGFRKGSRLVYMLLPRLAGRTMSLKRIRRLMKEHGMDSGIRGPNEARRQARKQLDDTIKPNILRRRFRLHRPNTVRVTDVTCLDYGDDNRAYGSALMDPVTSILIAFVISESNDLDMALATLREADSRPCADGGIFHSDMGTLYRTGDFQKEILERNLAQSMSKKGNCWDNATQESFFGHFKDECDYRACRTIEDLKKRVAQYKDYYNNERGLWDRCRMTPVEYEGYLLSLDEEAFAAYLSQEEEKYQKMRERAAELAKKRYGTLGV